jgi:hypothetical protein
MNRSQISALLAIAISLIGAPGTRVFAATGPDIVVETAKCSPENGFTADQIQQTLLAELQMAAPDSSGLISSPSVTAACVNQHEVAGIWLNAPGSADALTGIDILSSRAAFFGIQLTAAGAQNAVSTVWNQTPHVYDDSGNPDANGDNFLTGHTLTYNAAKAVVTLTANGHNHVSPGVDPTFKINFIDSLSITANEPSCYHNVSFSYDANVLWAAMAFFPLPFSAVPIDAILSDFGSASGDLLGDPDLQQISIGCFFSAFVPAEFLIPGTSTKIVFAYQAVTTSSADGIVFLTTNMADAPHLAPRAPAILPEAPFIAPVEVSSAGAPIAARLAVKLIDLRQQGTTPLTVHWSSTGKVDSPGVVCHRSSLTTTVCTQTNGGLYNLVTFPALPGNRRAVGAQTQIGTVTVTATDADNITATNTLGVWAKVIPDPVGTAKPATDPAKPIERE